MTDPIIPGGGGRRSARSPTQIDRQIGQLLRDRRTELGLRLEDVATSLELAPHQLQKYETGSNRVPASRLVACARLLQVPVSWFFNEVERLATDGADVSEEEVLIQLFRGLDEKGREQLLRIAKVLDGALPPNE